MRGAGRRFPRESLPADRKPPPTPMSAVDSWHYQSGTGRDSDASFCSSRPSISSVTVAPITDRSHQLAAIRLINSYLSSHSVSTVLKPPLPSARDITDTIRFILSRLDFPQSSVSKVEDDLCLVLKSLNCPFKLNKSAIRAPGTPHSWPSLLAVLHWLAQVAMYNDHLLNSTQSTSFLDDNSILSYAVNGYLHYLQGDDDTVDAMDQDFFNKLQQEKESVEAACGSTEENMKELTAKLEALRSGPSERETLEKEKSLLEEDVKKFHSMIEQLNGHITSVEKILQDKEKEFEAKVAERKRICDENEELKKSIEEQVVNARDAERMKRELQAVERDITDAELARNNWDEKSWDLDSAIQQKLKELDSFAIECNQAIRRLKLGSDLQYKINAKGSTPSEVLGIDYKIRINPALASFSDSVQASSMENLEECIKLQQQLAENASRIDDKKNRVISLQSHIDELESQMNTLRKETQDFASECAAEAKKLLEDVEVEACNLDVLEKEAAEYLKVVQEKLQEVTVETEEDVQKCARELFMLMDSVLKFKECLSTKIAKMKNDCIETVDTIADIHKGSLQVQYGGLLDVVRY